MRIIGGEWGSRHIDAPAEGLRPTSDRVREAMFNVLANVLDFSECTVCDCFAGSGALGIEALSRGARHATFVEKHKRTAGMITRNLSALGAGDRGTVIVGDALRMACAGELAADVIFADPPYDFTGLDPFVACVVERKLFARLFVVEHRAGLEPAVPGHAPWSRRRIGDTGMTIFLSEAT